MAISVFDLFRIGIGPSSSHTVGPMRAALRFVEGLRDDAQLAEVEKVRVELFGSLGATGRGHGSDRAVLLGLEGDTPDGIDPDVIPARMQAISSAGCLALLGKQAIAFDAGRDLVFHKREKLPFHSNGMRFTAYAAGDRVLRQRVYYSVGGGFVVNEQAAGADRIEEDDTELPYRFRSSAQLLAFCADNQASISDLMLANERCWRSEAEIRAGLLEIWQAMQDCVAHGIATGGVLPGPLKVRRRAPDLYRCLASHPEACLKDGLTILDWVNLYALAVNEENAAGGRVVTAPTNGAAGIVPAVLHYYQRFLPNVTDDGIVRFLLTAGAIGLLYKENASISGAEVGCQGEVGAASAMAAAGLCAALDGTNRQIENAAEIALEHHLGMTCDPIRGLVQVPCIERNGLGAIKAVAAASLALRGDGTHVVPLDTCIETMRQTGCDMSVKYKETSTGGLAVNLPEC